GDLGWRMKGFGEKGDGGELGAAACDGKQQEPAGNAARGQQEDIRESEALQPVNGVSVRDRHVSKADNDPDQQRKSAQLKERPEILHRIQTFAEGVNTMVNSVAEFAGNRAEDAAEEFRGGHRGLADPECYQRR